MREGGGELSSVSDIVFGRASEILPDGGGSRPRSRTDHHRPTVQEGTRSFDTLSNLLNLLQDPSPPERPAFDDVQSLPMPNLT